MSCVSKPPVNPLSVPLVGFKRRLRGRQRAPRLLSRASVAAAWATTSPTRATGWARCPFAADGAVAVIRAPFRTASWTRRHLYIQKSFPKKGLHENWAACGDTLVPQG